MSEDAGPHSRFPWGPAVLCAACLAMAAYTWMRCSYAWDMEPTDFWKRFADWPGQPVPDGWAAEDVSLVRRNEARGYICVPDQTLDGTFAEVRGILYGAASPRATRGRYTLVADDGIGFEYVGVVGLRAQDVRPDGTPLALDGRMRVDWFRCDVVVHVAASRFTGESVAGLVVGAMGAFVFGLYLRRWIPERRAAA